MITIAGFGLALWRIRKSEAASEQARKAAEHVREQILQMNAIQGLSAVIRTLEDIRRLHRAHVWAVLPDQYTKLKQDLIAIKVRTPNLTDDHRAEIQSTIQQFSNIERQVEKAIVGADEPAIDALNRTTTKQIDQLVGMLAELQKEIDQSRK